MLIFDIYYITIYQTHFLNVNSFDSSIAIIEMGIYNFFPLVNKISG